MMINDQSSCGNTRSNGEICNTLPLILEYIDISHDRFLNGKNGGRKHTSSLKKKVLSRKSSRKKCYPEVLRLFFGCKDNIECIDVTIINEQSDELSRIVESVFKRIRPLQEINTALHSINFVVFFGENSTVALKPRIFSTVSNSPYLLRILRCFKN
ncbi:uncharacterized protein LOC122536656 [Frieseomelitta varia]|uniref:uncharacterized protein LOC122536656 n=1 Tax=Frieseomelitta varia TaxID=561572 RepID=UPI001CB68AD8|nr:uncharacterized protein LOC122536656 [Frieseomelitta varia]